MRLPNAGRVFISVRDEDKASVTPIAQRLHRIGFEVVATRGTAAYFEARVTLGFDYSMFRLRALAHYPRRY